MNKFNAKDFFLNLGVTVALYTVVISLVNLLFTVINYAYPKVVVGYNYYYANQSISWPVASLIIVFPILILLMWILEKEYKHNTEDRNTGIHRVLTYVTLFITGLVLAVDLVMVLYYFLDGQELTTGFLLKVLALLVVAGSLFAYYLSDIRGTLTSKSRKIWRILTGVVILASIVWGFSVLGSPASQRAYKYDEQRVNDLMSLSNQISSYYNQTENFLFPRSFDDLVKDGKYGFVPVDPQTGQRYEFEPLGPTRYQLCAVFNKATPSMQNSSRGMPYENVSWQHPAGRHCYVFYMDTSNRNYIPVPGIKN